MHIRKWKVAKLKRLAILRTTYHARYIARESRRQQELLRMSQSRPIYTRPTKYSETMVARI